MGRGLRPETQEVLRRAGWSEGREVDPMPYMDRWKSRKVSTSDQALRFVREFGGLRLDHEPHVDAAGVRHMDFTVFDPISATDGISDRMLGEYSRLASLELCPVGQNRSHMTLLIAASGGFFGGVDNYLFYFGSNPNQALDGICSGARPKLVGEWRLTCNSSDCKGGRNGREI